MPSRKKAIERMVHPHRGEKIEQPILLGVLHHDRSSYSLDRTLHWIDSNVEPGMRVGLDLPPSTHLFRKEELPEIKRLQNTDPERYSLIFRNRLNEIGQLSRASPDHRFFLRVIDALLNKGAHVLPIMRHQDNEALGLLQIKHEQATDPTDRAAIWRQYQVRAAQKAANLLNDTLTCRLHVSILGAAHVANAERFAPDASTRKYLISREQQSDVRGLVSGLDPVQEKKMRAFFRRSK
ncbi:hypothetical protein KJ765_05690 [Candidatus Micrarchaeota archaeon]|nr:hypothetical protein [Candidatus Micrarchaeota archaeon]